MTIKITRIFRYPVKGLSAQSLDKVTLRPDLGIPDDRRFALAHAATQFDASAPKWLPKTGFMMLMRDERLATLETAYDEADETLSVFRKGRRVARGRITTPVGRAVIEDFFAAYMKREAVGKPRLLEAPEGHMFSDHRACVLSLIGAASITDLERVVGESVNPIRFRPNLIFEGAAPWDELKWPDREITIGGVRLKVTKRIDRCAAVNVDPQTAERDMNIPKALQRGFGHIDMGVYARVMTEGSIAVGDELGLS